MMRPRTKPFIFLFLFICSIAYGQMEQYSYKRELTGVSGEWHKLILPDEIFGKISQNLNDIRIFGITVSNDTVEAPYLLRLTTGNISGKEISFNTLNPSHNDKGYYFTFEIPAAEPINQIKLDFKQKNFDWRIKLEGSQNQNDWFTISDNYRILSIKNEITDFQFTLLTFPASKYRFFRLQIDSKEKPELNQAIISQNEITNGTFRNYIVKNFYTNENKEFKQTEIDVELQMPVPVSYLKLKVRDSFDYYRPLIVKYVTDSIKTEQGWKYNYSTLTSGTLNSIDKNGFTFSSTTVQKLKIIINNHDNQPLTIDSIQVKGYEHELLVRFTENATYYLTYGNKSASSPVYDITRFAGKIPVDLTILNLGNEQLIEKEETPLIEPLFKNKTWLWSIMGLIILVLGWFSIRMMRKN